MRLSVAAVAFGLAAGLVLTAAPSRAADDQKWGTIKGQVVLDGAVPQPEKIDVNKDQEHCLKNGPLYSEKWVVNPKNKGVRWAFVYLVPAPDPNDPARKQTLPVNPALRNPPKDPVEMDQPCCQFEPHAVGLREGQAIVFKNGAPISHNVHWTGGIKNPGNNVILPAGGKIEVSDLVAYRLPVSVKCDIHGWMQAWVYVFDNPYYAVTDADGNFEIKDAPAGTYNLVIWQESTGWRDVKTVEADGKKVRILGTPVTIKPDTTTDLGKFGLKPKAD
jgi:hypothetical protein